jgi:hypothetical protein
MHRQRIRGAIGFGSGTIGPFEEVATHSGSAGDAAARLAGQTLKALLLRYGRAP